MIWNYWTSRQKLLVIHQTNPPLPCFLINSPFKLLLIVLSRSSTSSNYYIVLCFYLTSEELVLFSRLSILCNSGSSIIRRGSSQTLKWFHLNNSIRSIFINEYIYIYSLFNLKRWIIKFYVSFHHHICYDIINIFHDLALKISPRIRINSNSVKKFQNII